MEIHKEMLKMKTELNDFLYIQLTVALLMLAGTNISKALPRDLLYLLIHTVADFKHNNYKNIS